MKILISTIAVTLALASTVPAVWATGINGNSQTTHFVDSAAYPNNARIPNATHEFELHVAGRAISQLSIGLPEGVNITDGIKVADNLGNKIQATVSANNRKATIDFDQFVS